MLILVLLLGFLLAARVTYNSTCGQHIFIIIIIIITSYRVTFTGKQISTSETTKLTMTINIKINPHAPSILQYILEFEICAVEFVTVILHGMYSVFASGTRSVYKTDIIYLGCH